MAKPMRTQAQMQEATMLNKHREKLMPDVYERYTTASHRPVKRYPCNNPKNRSHAWG